MKQRLCILIFFVSVIAQAKDYQTFIGETNVETLTHYIKQHASHPDKDLKSYGMAQHQLALQQVRGSSQLAVTYLKKAAKLEKNNPIILMFLGSAYTMLARDSVTVANKVRFVNRGLRYMDKAFKMDEHHLDLRFLRAANMAHLPKMFKRRELAKEELEAILKISTSKQMAVMAHKAFDQLVLMAKEDQNESDITKYNRMIEGV